MIFIRLIQIAQNLDRLDGINSFLAFVTSHTITAISVNDDY